MTSNNKTPLNIKTSPFGITPDGESVQLFRLTNAQGMSVALMDFGGVVLDIQVPDKHGKFENVNLGFDNLAAYCEVGPYFGAIIGRFGNRIAGGKFSVDGQVYELDTNNGPNHLHGGWKGFDKVIWQSQTFEKADAVGVILKYLSADGDQGYPGNLQVTVTYELNNSNTLSIHFHAITDKATPVNLTQHSYFNLQGAGNGDVLSHEIQLHAETLTAIDGDTIPTGEYMAVAGTPFDFRSPQLMGARINEPHEQLRNGNGYDHNFVLQKNQPNEFSLAARVCEKNSGRVLEVYTQAPGVQFYTGNWLDGSQRNQEKIFNRRTGFCLEPQYFPDSPNQPNFPNCILQPGEVYDSSMCYKFSVMG
jgi:aldose 1-epimerase